MDKQRDASAISARMFAKTRRMHVLDGLSIREVSRAWDCRRSTIGKGAQRKPGHFRF